MTGRNGLVWLVMACKDDGPQWAYRYTIDVIVLDGLPGERARYHDRCTWRIDSFDDPAYVFAPDVERPVKVSATEATKGDARR